MSAPRLSNAGAAVISAAFLTAPSLTHECFVVQPETVRADAPTFFWRTAATNGQLTSLSGEDPSLLLYLGFLNDEEVLRSGFASIENDVSMRWAKQLASRLRVLLDEFKDFNDGVVFSMDSFRALQLLLPQIATARAPTVTVTDAGELFIRWKRSAGEVLSLRLYSPNSVSYAVFKQLNGSVITSSGKGTLSNVLQEVKPATLPWVYE